jgi:hypothetical protein
MNTWYKHPSWIGKPLKRPSSFEIKAYLRCILSKSYAGRTTHRHMRVSRTHRTYVGTYTFRYRTYAVLRPLAHAYDTHYPPVDV